MTTLDDAWSWCDTNLQLVNLMGRLGGEYWDKLPWDLMGRDDHFRLLEAEDVETKAKEVSDEFEDIAIFVLFSVFEANVRDRTLTDIGPEVAKLSHPALRKAAERTLRSIEEGAFYSNVLELYKGVDHFLVEEVNRIRKYRNWVAHGRRTEKPSTLKPKDVLGTLKEFLNTI